MGRGGGCQDGSAYGWGGRRRCGRRRGGDRGLERVRVSGRARARVWEGRGGWGLRAEAMAGGRGGRSPGTEPGGLEGWGGDRSGYDSAALAGSPACRGPHRKGGPAGERPAAARGGGVGGGFGGWAGVCEERRGGEDGRGWTAGDGRRGTGRHADAGGAGPGCEAMRGGSGAPGDGGSAVTHRRTWRIHPHTQLPPHPPPVAEGRAPGGRRQPRRRV